MARKLDLRTGRTVWQAYRAQRVRGGPVSSDIKADVLVVGAGISGAMIAEALTAQGHDVAVIDRRGPMLGSTAATTALVQFEIDVPLTKLVAKIGREKAERAWRRSRLAVGNLLATIEELGIRCDVERTPSLYLAGNMLSPAPLRDEAEARRRAGLHATYLEPPDLKERFGIDRDGAILSHDNVTLDPRKLTAGLLLKAIERGARLFFPVEATGFDHSADEVVVSTAEGPAITAKHVILATGYELAEVAASPKHSIISTWAIATKPQPRAIWPQAALIWEASDPYLYARATSDGRVICGGEDEDFTDENRRDALIDRKSAMIAGKLGVLFPHLDVTPEFAWAGSFGTTSTGLPIIGPLPRKPRIFAVMGYGGNGITFSRIAAELVSNALAEREDSDADLFAF